MIDVDRDLRESLDKRYRGSLDRKQLDALIEILEHRRERRSEAFSGGLGWRDSEDPGP
jgi:hypothetical protein